MLKMSFSFINDNKLETTDYGIYSYDKKEILLLPGGFHALSIIELKANYELSYQKEVVPGVMEEDFFNFSIHEKTLERLVEFLEKVNDLTDEELEELVVNDASKNVKREEINTHNMFVVNENTALILYSTTRCGHGFLNITIEFHSGDLELDHPLLLVMERDELEDLIILFKFSISEIKERKRTLKFLQYNGGEDPATTIHRKGLELALSDKDELELLIERGVIEDLEED